MPIRHAIWVVGEQPKRLAESSLLKERLLEDMIEGDSSIISDEWMLIGRQRGTEGGPFDLLAVAPDGALVLIELKRDRTRRDVVAQALDYAGTIEKLTATDVADIYTRFSKGGSFKDDFRKRFGFEINDESLNKSHQIVIVASQLDPGTERIVRYLSERAVPINVLFFQVFTAPGGEQLLSRAWLIDPAETQLNAAAAPRGATEPWNGEFYVSFGDGSERSWDEARKYGFISAGGGEWYTRTLKLLGAGDRVWVNIPAKGYVGVGRVTGPVSSANDFVIPVNGGPQKALDVLSAAHYHRALADDAEQSEYFVPVKWLEAVPASQAFSETGFFGNQNTVCKPTTPKWRHSIERLKHHFTQWDEDWNS